MIAEMIINDAYRAFSSFSRPEHFTDYTHCDECEEHDNTMRSCSLSEIGSNHVGNPGWSPIPFFTEQAFGYVMPRLLELALTNGINAHGEPFVFQYLLALTPLPEHRKFNNFTPEQAAVVLKSLYYIRDHMGAVVENECCQNDLTDAIALWEAIAPNNSLNPTPHSSARTGRLRRPAG